MPSINYTLQLIKLQIRLKHLTSPERMRRKGFEMQLADIEGHVPSSAISMSSLDQNYL